MKFATRYSNRIKSSISFEGEPTRTKQSFKTECDVNHIVARYKKTGELPRLARQDARYGDFSDVPSYLEALERVQIAEAAFAALPAAVRKDCDNDPEVFLRKVQDPRWALQHKLALPVEVNPPGQPSSGSAPGQGAKAGTEPAAPAKPEKKDA